MLFAAEKIALLAGSIVRRFVCVFVYLFFRLF